MSTIQLLHGTDHIIEVPDINIGNPHNDYGRGLLLYPCRGRWPEELGHDKRTRMAL